MTLAVVGNTLFVGGNFSAVGDVAGDCSVRTPQLRSQSAHFFLY
jgi:hypothetical protein